MAEMDMKEKLVELLEDCSYRPRPNCMWWLIADHLIANGVTVQEWISVKDRLPEQYDTVVGWDGKLMGEVNHNGKEFVWLDDDGWNGTAFVTHWMPLPQPPKGE